MSSLVTFDRATLGYGRRAVLTDISFDIPEGDFLGLVGPNGAGRPPFCERSWAASRR
jgi:ABC-type Mn2+/Zn2+ transport system ATPase subunit